MKAVMVMFDSLNKHMLPLTAAIGFMHRFFKDWRSGRHLRQLLCGKSSLYAGT